MLCGVLAGFLELDPGCVRRVQTPLSRSWHSSAMSGASFSFKARTSRKIHFQTRGPGRVDDRGVSPEVGDATDGGETREHGAARASARPTATATPARPSQRYAVQDRDARVYNSG